MAATPPSEVRATGGRRRRVVLGLVAVGAVLAGAALVVRLSATPAPAPAPVAVAEPLPTTTAPPPTTEAPSPVPRQTTIATVSGPLPYADSPGGPTAGTLPVGSWWTDVKELPVIEQAPGWLHVRLPQRPNGSTGWIAADSAQLSTTTNAVLIDVTARRLRLYDSGAVVADLPAGVGTTGDPTPLGQFYVMDVAESRGPGWGPFIIDTNAHSEAITSWEGSGDAFTAIHGPLGADAAIGTTGAAISHGCVRLHVDDLAKLSPVGPGTPVVIVA